ncbi:MAG: hypothetical protein DID89_2727547575 [Candidatus Nitrotoga sp. CP45]|nr:MAG: hypothetical protein DID89_2727547575 [Candidatus Nitrotoga sp. CP45]
MKLLILERKLALQLQFKREFNAFVKLGSFLVVK